MGVRDSGVGAGDRATPRRRWWWATLAVAVSAALAATIRRLGPLPGVLLIRYLFDRDSARVTAALQAHRPGQVATIRDQQYRQGDRDALLDVHLLAKPGPRPTVLWVHGGAWVSGSRKNVVPYFELIAAQGYTVIAVDYSLAPAATYPAALRQLNDALVYLQAQADRLHVDTGRLVLAGDSAGAQLVSQLAALTTVPRYAAELELTPAIRPDQLVGVILHSGYYDMRTFIDRGLLAPTAFRWGIGTVVRAYTGDRATDSTAIRQMSTIDHVTADFPPTFITGGNADPLTDAHSRPFAARLNDLGVDVTTRFVPADHQPALGHEFQFDLDNEDGVEVLRRTVQFLADHTR
jgi:acetyl esterase/lipase